MNVEQYMRNIHDQAVNNLATAIDRKTKIKVNLRLSLEMQRHNEAPVMIGLQEKVGGALRQRSLG